MNRNLVIAIIVGLVVASGIVWYMTTGISDTRISGKTNLESSAEVSSSVSGTARVIDVKASRFSYDPGTITVKKGDKIKLNIDNSDTSHGIIISELSVSGIDSVEFTADKVGTYEFKCPTMCGSGHRTMNGTLIVEE